MITKVTKPNKQNPFLQRLATAQKIWEFLQVLPGQLSALQRRLDELEQRLDRMQQALGRIEERQTSEVAEIGAAAEFQVFSQWGEDGLLQAVLRKLPEIPRTFVEFGVETFIEANCRWLLVRHGWSGLVMDGSERNIAAIRRDPIYWRHNLRAVQAFITAENINELLAEHAPSGELGLLSIDVDGVDYWIWQAVQVRPAVVVVEYNSLFGPERAVTVPYRADFQRERAHFSCSYYGASLAALTKLGQQKGYALVAGNRAGNNAIFVRRDYLREGLPERSVGEVYVQRGFREARNEQGGLAHPDFAQEAAIVNALPLVEV